MSYEDGSHNNGDHSKSLFVLIFPLRFSIAIVMVM